MTSFWNDKERLQRLSGIREDDSDDTDALNGESRRQHAVIKHITEVFNHLRLPLAEENAVVYYESENFEATVTLSIMGDGISIRTLSQLYNTGLGKEYTINFAKSHGIQINFEVSENKRDL